MKIIVTNSAGTGLHAAKLASVSRRSREKYGYARIVVSTGRPSSKHSSPHRFGHRLSKIEIFHLDEYEACETHPPAQLPQKHFVSR